LKENGSITKFRNSSQEAFVAGGDEAFVEEERTAVDVSRGSASI